MGETLESTLTDFGVVENHGTRTPNIPFLENLQNSDNGESRGDGGASGDAHDLKSKLSYDFTSGKFLNISESLIEKWRGAFPAVDVPTELRRMESWMLANPSNRKSNWHRFIVNWLTRTQDRARPLKKGNFNDKVYTHVGLGEKDYTEGM